LAGDASCRLSPLAIGVPCGDEEALAGARDSRMRGRRRSRARSSCDRGVQHWRGNDVRTRMHGWRNIDWALVPDCEKPECLEPALRNDQRRRRHPGLLRADRRYVALFRLRLGPEVEAVETTIEDRRLRRLRT